MTDTQVYAELYRERLLRRHRWRLRHTNGNILADSGQSYSRREDAIAGLSRVTGTRYVPETGHLAGMCHDGMHRRIRLVFTP